MPLPSLRPEYQVPAFNRLRESYRAGRRSPLLQLPTGAGKTTLGAHFVEGARQKMNRVWWVCDQLSLIDQASTVFERFGIPHGVIQSDHPRWRPYERVQVCSIQTLARRKLHDDVAPQLVIIDEAHSFYKAHEQLMASLPNAKFLGLSATPWTKGLGKFFDELVVGVTTQELTDMGFLVPVRVFAPSEPNLKGVKVVAGEWQEDALAQACDQPDLVGDIVATWILRGESRRTLCFAVNVAHSKHIVEQFRASGIAAEHIDGYMDRAERAPIIERFRAGEIQVLSNVGVLTKGFDVPEVGCIIEARPIRSSLMLYIQMVGRGLRPAEGKADCIILDHAGNTLRHGFPTDPLPDELDDGKKEKKAKAEPKLAEPKKCPKCKLVKPRGAWECPSCGHKPEKQNEIFHEQGELTQFKQVPFAVQALYYQQLLHIQQEKGRSHGWVAHAFKEKFGAWPNKLQRMRLEPLPPTQSTLDDVRKKAQNFARRAEYARQKERAGVAA